MRFNEIIEPSLDDYPFIKPFMIFAAQQLGLEELPRVELESVDTDRPSFGSYNPNTHVIKIGIHNRHPVDVCRTLAHEMVHHSQNIKGELTPDSGEDGSVAEDEANSQAGVILRRYGKANPEMFSMESLEA